MRYISRFQNSIRASSIYSLAFMLTFALAGSLISVEEAAAQREIELSVMPESVMEGVDQMTITVTATRDTTLASADTLTVKIPDDEEGNFSITEGVNIEGTGKGRTLEVVIQKNAEEGSNTFQITTVDDNVFEAYKKLTLSGTAENSNSFVVPATLELQDDDQELTLTATPDAIKEDGGQKRITVMATLAASRGIDTAIPVNISQKSGSYTLNKTSLMIDVDAGDTMGTANFDITPVDDNVYNGAVKIEVTLASSSNLAVRGPATITLNDDEELPALALSASPERIGEGQGARRVTVTATLKDGVLLPTSTRVNVTIGTNAAQYSLSTAALAITIPANQSSGQARVNITPVNDAVFEADATEVVTFTGNATLVAGDAGSARTASTKVSIADDDHEVALMVSQGTVTGADDETVVTVTATLSRPANRALTIPVMAPDSGGDYVLTSTALSNGILSIEIAANESKGTASLTVNPDTKFSDEDYDASVEIKLSVDPTSPLAGLSTKITVAGHQGPTGSESWP